MIHLPFNTQAHSDEPGMRLLNAWARAVTPPPPEALAAAFSLRWPSPLPGGTGASSPIEAYRAFVELQRESLSNWADVAEAWLRFVGSKPAGMVVPPADVGSRPAPVRPPQA
jgi:hypothetical protein